MGHEGGVCSFSSSSYMSQDRSPGSTLLGVGKRALFRARIFGLLLAGGRILAMVQQFGREGPRREAGLAIEFGRNIRFFISGGW